MPRRGRNKRVKDAGLQSPGEPLVNEFAAGHGLYELTNVVDLSGELGGRRNSIVKVMLNRGGTAIERWIAAGALMEGEVRAVRYCQSLWIRIEGSLRAVDPAIDPVLASVDGWSQQEAIDEIKWIESVIPARYWAVFENVCRWDEPAGAAGSRLATNNRSAIDSAKVCVAFTAAVIALARGL